MSKKYQVRISVEGSIFVDIEAKSEDEAMEKASKLVGKDVSDEHINDLSATDVMGVYSGLRNEYAT